MRTHAISRRLLLALVLLPLLVGLGLAHGGPRLLPPEAIAFSGFLSKAEFDERFPGRIIEDTATLPQGWYVRYQHEALVYLFGPVRFAATAEDYAASLRRIVSDAVRQRPELANHEIAVIALPDDTDSDTSPSRPDSEPRDSRAGGPPQPPPPPEPWWQRLLGIFRRG
jgi:hypothetical protein